LVKGLDYALLAQRKAELEREGDETADKDLEEQLEGIGRNLDNGNGRKMKLDKPAEEKLSNKVSLHTYRALSASRISR
jgi:hypothetical protein